MDRELKLLIIEDDPDDAIIVKKLLSQTTLQVQCSHVDRLELAFKNLITKEYDLILTDLFLPDSQGLETFIKIAEATDIPIVILSGLNDEKVALEAVSKGAQDYLSKSNLSPQLLSRVLMYALQRNEKQMALREQSLIDELTGLYNRRGFLTMAAKQLNLLNHSQQGFIVFLMDLDYLKKINDQLGHAMGDDAIKKVAYCLKKTFKQADVMARIGGDEFAAIITQTQQGDIENSKLQLEKTVKECNNDGKPYTLSLSIGGVYVSSTEESLENILIQADKELYKDKSVKHSRL